MSRIEGGSDEPSPTENGLLDVLPPNQRLLTKACNRSKRGKKGFNKPENLMTPTEAKTWVRDGRNVGIRPGLTNSDSWTFVVLDVESAGDLLREAGDLLEPYVLTTFRSPHGGLNRVFRVTDDAYQLLKDVPRKVDLDDDGDHELEILTNGHALAPPSEIDHSNCRGSKANCPGHGIGAYELVEFTTDVDVVTESVAKTLLDTLNITPEESTTESSRPEHTGELPEVTLTDGKVDEVLRTLQEVNPVSFNALMALLQGGVGPWEDRLYTDGSVDRSLQELMALTRLYLSARELANLNDDEARQLAQNALDQYTEAHPQTIDGQPRKWTTSPYDDYQKDRREKAFNTADPVTFQRFLNLTSGDHETDYEKWDGEYSDVTYDITRFTIDLFTRPHKVEPLVEGFDTDPVEGLRTYASITFDLDLDTEVAEYLYDRFFSTTPHPLQDVDPPSGGAVRSSSVNVRPTKRDVVEVALVIDNGLDEDPREDDRSEGTYMRAVGDLKKWGELKMAECYSRPNGGAIRLLLLRTTGPTGCRPDKDGWWRD